MKKDVVTTQTPDQVDELCEDMILVGPGQILSEARKKLSLTPEAVAKKLNFREKLVEDIENDIFDPHLPATFNRGYLRNYAKLVAVDVEEVLAAYDLLGQAEVQRSEMQSFSNLTEKQAEHSRLMWLSYLIAAILMGLMVVWWVQTPSTINTDVGSTEASQVDVSKAALIADSQVVTDASTTSEAQNLEITTTTQAQTSEPLNLAQGAANELATASIPAGNAAAVNESSTQEQDLKSTAASATTVATATDTSAGIENDALALDLASAVFTFSGDCWVNIYDATGERIAWGVKKSGYVMTVSGKAPLQVTLGKPELAEITFNGQVIDMSPFNVGNIAKFSLPLSL